MNNAFVVVDAFDYYADAGAAKALLETHGITVVLTDVETTSANWLWTGWTGGIKVSVPQDQAAEARQVLSQIRASNRQLSRTPNALLENACLGCGKEMVEGTTACAACGWSFSGEEVTSYKNGPVPDSLLRFAYSPIDSRRFALPAALISKYLDWCKSMGLEVEGWEVWRRGFPLHIVSEIRRAGTALDVRAAAEKASLAHDDDMLFCVNIKGQGEAAEDDA